MVKTLIIYESRYGSTEKIAKDLSLILGPAKVCRSSEFKVDNNNFDVVVICTPVYIEFVDDNILQFVHENAEWLKQKKVVLLGSCLGENRVLQYLKPLKDILGKSVVLQSSIGGELTISKLTKSDYDSMKKFYTYIGAPFNDCKLFNKNKFAELALNIKKIKDIGNKIVEEQKLREYIDDFIKNHNTCALSTGHDDRVRVTPIEYSFLGESLYIISEGGEKFLNILMNPNVSICIYDSYKNMSDLAGMQIMGTAQILDIGSDEGLRVLAQKGLNYDNIVALPVALNLIKVNIKMVEFLWSGFDKLGYDTKQILNYQK